MYTASVWDVLVYRQNTIFAPQTQLPSLPGISHAGYLGNKTMDHTPDPSELRTSRVVAVRGRNW